MFFDMSFKFISSKTYTEYNGFNINDPIKFDNEKTYQIMEQKGKEIFGKQFVERGEFYPAIIFTYTNGKLTSTKSTLFNLDIIDNTIIPPLIITNPSLPFIVIENLTLYQKSSIKKYNVKFESVDILPPTTA